MAKSTVIAVHETDSHWDITQRRVEKDRTAMGTRDGSHLKPMFVDALTLAGATGLASQIDGIAAGPESAYDATERHTMSIESARGGNFVVKVLTKDNAGNQKVTGDYEAASYGALQSAFAGLAASLDAPLFAAQIAAL